MEPASTIIELCGGVSAVSEMTGRDVSRVHRWTYAREKGGSNGLIPTDAAQDLMRVARERGIPLTPEHFFPTQNQGAA